MTAQEIKVLIAIISLCKSGGETVDVFDVIYETGIRYQQIKPYLDGLVNAGEIEAQDLRYYTLCGEPDEKLKELTEKYPKEIKAAQTELCGQDSNEIAKSEEDADAAKRKEAFDKRREEFLRRLRERREAAAAELSEEEAEEEDDDDDDDDDDDIDYEEIRRIINGDDAVKKANDAFYKANCEKYTDELIKTVREAFLFAHNRMTDFVGSGHLVYAMIFNDCKAGEILLDCSTSRVYYGYYLRSAFGDLPESDCAELSEEAKSMLNRAVEIAEEAGGKGTRASTVHLLKAILESPKCVAVQCLAEAHTDMEKLTVEIEKYLSTEN